MAEVNHPKLAGIDLKTSYILGVIYDDESLTLEIDFHLLDDHPSFGKPENEEGCYKQGFIRFSEMDDLRLKKTKSADGEEVDLSDIYSAQFEGDYAFLSSGWGEIELTAKSIQIALD
ncbi:hypothetical protein [Pontixanthobacter aquaemixtae]|uniref:Uncharacterized protein n=1 Tax=Pontixanthobacter aquaemixtae TaxID=1958940 RepID=A0A844ZQT6_9SPHN|nr:hypothetical protein [Pontixanthobacter aquaemixtae]MXO90108.1 hypothetical protein [Pontixanthobacter aquaemixtae]